MNRQNKTKLHFYLTKLAANAMLLTLLKTNQNISTMTDKFALFTLTQQLESQCFLLPPHKLMSQTIRFMVNWRSFRDRAEAACYIESSDTCNKLCYLFSWSIDDLFIIRKWSFSRDRKRSLLLMIILHKMILHKYHTLQLQRDATLKAKGVLFYRQPCGSVCGEKLES